MTDDTGSNPVDLFQTVGVIGAGQMGHGIALTCAFNGLNVVLMDASADSLEKGMGKIKGWLDRQIKKGQITNADREATLSRLTTGQDFSVFTACDMVIEAASENEEVKRSIFKALVPHLKPETMLSSNTSSISITRLAASTDRPDKFCGCHFMNPVPAMKLVELIRGLATSQETFSAFQLFAEKLGKTVAISEDFPGFIVNRILLPMINEAIYTLYEGVGTVTAIDTAMKLGTKHPLGPLELADFIGLDTCLAILGVLHGDLADSKYRPCPLLMKYVEAGWLGVKTGRGFYDYSQAEPRPTR